jgi:hypothetical protein
MPKATEQSPAASAVRPPRERRPVEPFAAWPVQYLEPSVGFYWYFEPATLICQSFAPHGTLEVIDRHNDVVDRVLARHRKEIQAAGGLFMLFDWRSVQGYDQDARARQRERMQARGKTYARRTVVVIHPANRLLRMAVGAANLFATMFLKSQIEILTDPTAVVADAKLAPPPRNQPFV